MKRIPVLVLILLISITPGCKKNSPDSDEISLAKKYARYSTPVYKDRELNTWLATLSKTESVDLLALEKVLIKNKPVEIASVKLSDDSKGFVAAANLADRPLVFIEDTKAHVRNNEGSKVEATIPRGTIGFIMEEKGNWVQVYVGKIGEKYITKQWVQGGFSTETALILEARTYEEACSVLAKKKTEVKPELWEEALEKLQNLKSSSSIFAGLASDKMAALEGKVAVEEEKEETVGGDNTEHTEGENMP
ncbi:MAG: hypothetical protein CVV44_12645 [Spirochaetae bacterium HGW-Spirochaetae-1]|jgi:lipoprotein LenA|nr:MAG: hypothetical protein CVV44_12645 [Spirochaetae bacterium HGW-Spirochaetae-1]